MEEILKFENRQKLYQFLVDSYGFTVKEEKNYNEMGYYVDLSITFFLLRYYNDRLFLSIDIASLYDETRHLYALSFIRDLIYNPESINASDEIEDNVVWINGLNDFLRKDFGEICELLNKENYPDTKIKIDKGLEKTFFIKYPFAKRYVQ